MLTDLEIRTLVYETCGPHYSLLDKRMTVVKVWVETGIGEPECGECEDMLRAEALVREVLKRAAEPKDAAAEREHCKSIADALCNSMDIVTQNYSEWAEVAAAFERERAAARAEVETRFVAERAELCIVRKDRDDWKSRCQQVTELETKLAAVERLLAMQHADSSVQVSALREALENSGH